MWEQWAPSGPGGHQQGYFDTSPDIDTRTIEQREADSKRVAQLDAQVANAWVAFKAWEADILAQWEAVGQYVRIGSVVVPLRIGTDHWHRAASRFIATDEKFGEWGKRVPCTPFYLINQSKKYAFGVDESSDAKWAEEVCHGKWDGNEGKYHEVSLYRFVDDSADEPWCMKEDFAKRVKARESK